jgi:hypothetical protein
MFDLQLFGGHTPDLPICRAKKKTALDAAPALVHLLQRKRIL